MFNYNTAFQMNNNLKVRKLQHSIMNFFLNLPWCPSEFTCFWGFVLCCASLYFSFVFCYFSDPSVQHVCAGPAHAVHPHSPPTDCECPYMADLLSLMFLAVHTKNIRLCLRLNWGRDKFILICVFWYFSKVSVKFCKAHFWVLCEMQCTQKPDLLRFQTRQLSHKMDRRIGLCGEGFVICLFMIL